MGDGLAQGLIDSLPSVEAAARSAMEAAAVAVSGGGGAGNRGSILSTAAVGALSDSDGTVRRIVEEAEGRGPRPGGGTIDNRRYEITQVFNEKVSPKHMAAELVWKL